MPKPRPKKFISGLLRFQFLLRSWNTGGDLSRLQTGYKTLGSLDWSHDCFGVYQRRIGGLIVLWAGWDYEVKVMDRPESER